MDEEEQRERERAEQSILALREEKSKILAERKLRIQEKASLLGGDKEEHEQLIKSHDENTQRLINKIDAERLRMEADLHERLRKKREVRYKVKESEMQEELLKKRKQMEESDRQRRQNLDKKEKQKLEQLHESLQDQLSSGLQSEEMNMQHDNMGSTVLALPITEQEMTLLLLSSPLYQKLDEIAVLLQNQPLVNSSHHVDPRDAIWISDTELHVIDVNLISPKAFVIYKFGCCIINSLTATCNHDPVSLLVADKIPPNIQIKQNAFCNSFVFDDKNRILYMRLERLENMGEFVLILVHILSHIQVGSFNDDSDPKFVREFYRCLSVCCNDFFLSRYQGTLLTWSEVHKPDGLQLTAQGGVKELLVDDLLHSKLKIDDTERGFKHLQRYTEIKFGSKLSAYLDDLKEGRHSKDNSNKELTATTSKVATRSLNKESYWRTVVKPAVHSSYMHTNQYQQFLQEQTRDLKERIGELNAEYAQVAKERGDVNAKVRNLDELLTAHQKTLTIVKDDELEAQKQIVKNTAIKLSAAKTEQATYDLRLNSCLKQLDGFRAQLTQKQTLLEECK